ncbi:type IV secretion system protein [Helicobacter sp. 11S03491-1]|uniref:type IV secretion system protein n=1 Tax=Helicobacter sp. 11S03491-1 TaxID=1476196 RepID=UPI000BA57569|nr:type IV secretion system protein [Helicobacter sp. 11S03491-1]PAF42183.1 hypothetical protein BKH45_04345 [Helicobacter sp. 11S03491-1]
MNDIYANLMGSFTNVLGNFGNSLAQSISETLKLQFIFPAMISVLIWIWAIKKIKDRDMFEIKAIVNLCIFLAYIAFSGWALNDPTKFMEYFNNFIKLPSEVLSDGITKAIAKTGTLTQIEEKTGIDTIITQNFQLISSISKTIWKDFSIFKIGGTIFQILLGTIAILIQLIYLCILCIIIIMTTIQYYVWSSMAIFFIGLMLFPQTRGILGAYLKLLISLTLYQPALLLMASLNTGAMNALIKITPTTVEIKNNSIFNINVLDTYEIIGIFFLMCVVGVISILLLQFISKIIDSLMGTQSDISGAGNITNMATKGTAAVASMLGGAAAGSALGLMKQAYSQGGGGMKGLANAALAGLTGGGSVAAAPLAKKAKSLIQKGISFGASKLGGGKK